MPKKYDDVNQVKRSKYVFSDRVTKEGRDNNKGRNKGSNQQSSPAETYSNEEGAHNVELRHKNGSDTQQTPSPNTLVVSVKASIFDRFLILWISSAMCIGLLLGWFFPQLKPISSRLKLDSVSLPLAFGLLLTMYPVFAKVRYSKIRYVANDPRLLATSLILNWLVGPTLMWGLAWLTLPDQPEFRTGVIMVGLARCIGLVFIWNELAAGDVEATEGLMLLNSLFQIVAYSLLWSFYIEILPRWLGLSIVDHIDNVTMWQIARTVLILLGTPMVAGFITRLLGESSKGWYEERFLPWLRPVSLFGRVFTIVVIFTLQGDKLIEQPLHVAYIAVPLLAYFGIMWTLAFLICKLLDINYARSISVAETAAGNNFELSIAVVIGVFGLSGAALPGVVRALFEIPTIFSLLHIALWIRRYFRSFQSST